MDFSEANNTNKKDENMSAYVKDTNGEIKVVRILNTKGAFWKYQAVELSGSDIYSMQPGNPIGKILTAPKALFSSWKSFEAYKAERIEQVARYQTELSN